MRQPAARSTAREEGAKGEGEARGDGKEGENRERGGWKGDGPTGMDERRKMESVGGNEVNNWGKE